MFLGRENELEFLSERYNSSKAEFIVIYGRRRIGKTELIKEFVKNKPHIFYTAVQMTNKIQLNKISDIISGYFDDKKYREPFSSWENVFKYIADCSDNKEKLVVIIDEFPYLVESNKGIPSLLQYIWDHHLKNKNIMLVISGSSMSFMERKILSEKNPLYGRATGIYKVQEMDFYSAKGFMPGSEMTEAIIYYSIFSGVPYYLDQIDKNRNMDENIKASILRNGAILFNEAEFLLKQELRDVYNYNSIIGAIALGNTKLNDIYTKTEIDKNKLPYYINNLIDLNIIEREFPITIKTKEKAKSKIGLYKLLNSYFRFYYAFVYPNLSELLEGNVDNIFKQTIKPNIDGFVSLEFEKVCIQYLRSLNRAGNLPFLFTKIGRWWSKDTEIDLVAFDVKGNYIFGECKWRNKKTGINVLHALKEKSKLLGNDVKTAYYMLFSKCGFTNDLIEISNNDNNITLVNIEDI
jgi:uncharacterized protein